ncbi:MAG: RNA polymerase sigma factor [Polyangiaceae bacterium]
MTRTRELADRVARSGAAAFSPIVAATQDRLFRAAMRLLGQPADSEDAVQETYARAFTALSEGRYEERGEIVGFLLTILTRVAIDLRRARALREAAPVDESIPSSRGVTQAQLLASIELARLLDLLPFEQRVVVVLRHLEGMTSREVAVTLGITEGAVEQRNLRALTNLRKGMSHE